MTAKARTPNSAEQDVERQRDPEQRLLGQRRQPRARPAEREGDERHDQDGRGGGTEQRLGNREVGAADDSMREEEHAPSL